MTGVLSGPTPTRRFQPADPGHRTGGTPGRARPGPIRPDPDNPEPGAPELTGPGPATGPWPWVLPVLAAVTGWWPLLPWAAGPALVLVVAANVGVVLAAGRLPRGSRPATAVLAVAAPPLLGLVPALIAGTGDWTGDLTERSMVFAELPVTDPAALHLLATVTGWAAVTAVLLARSGAAAPVCAGPAVLLLAWAGIVAHPQLRLDAAAALLGAAVLLAAAAPARRNRAGAVLVLTLAAVAATGLTRLDTTRPTDPTLRLGAAPLPVAAADPMATAADWSAGQPRLLLRLDPAPQGRVRWAVLDRYDGMTWTAAACAGTPGPAAVGEPVTITGNTVPGPWLPVPEHLTGTDTGRPCPGTGTLLVTTEAPAGYTVRSTGPDSTGQEPEAPGPADPVSAEDRDLAAALSGDLGGREALTELEQVLGRGNLDPQAVPGQERATLHAVARGERPGQPGQFAGAYAMLAGALGHPSRVVVGFEAGPRVHSTDVRTWPEVWVDGRWHRFDPVPEQATAPEHSARAVTAPAQDRQAAVPAPAPPAGPETQTPGPDGPAPTTALLATTGLVSMLVLAGAAAVVVRRRNRRADDAGRIAAQWTATLDLLRRADPQRRDRSQWRAMTARQVLTAGSAVLGPDATADLRTLTGLITQLAYSGQDLPAGAVADARRARAAIRSTLTRRRLRRPR